MSKFKVGDLVVRTTQYRGKGWLHFCEGLGVPASAPMRVTFVDGDTLFLENWNSMPWSGDFFVDAGPTIPAPQEAPREHTDAVNSPKHYQFFLDLEAIEVIARSMTEEQFYGYCLGNRLKYRLRAGNKDKLEQDIAKSDKYLELFEKHKGLCHG